MPLLTELGNVLECDFYKDVASDGADFFDSLHCLTQEQPV
jgi:hypothetical protein